MPDVDDIIAAMVGFMRGVGSAGTVHDRPRSLSPAQTGFSDRLAKLCRFEPNGYRGWVLDYLLSTERTGTSTSGGKLAIGEVERTLRFRFWWVYPFDDAGGSTAIHRAMFEDMAAMMRQRRSFGFGRGVVENALLQAQEPRDPIPLSQSQGSMHVGEARMDVRLVIAVANAC